MKNTRKRQEKTNIWTKVEDEGGKMNARLKRKKEYDGKYKEDRRMKGRMEKE